MIVFRPFIGEILVGKVANSSKEGLKISLDFFDDIIVPQQFLKPGTVYDKDLGLWVWKYTDEDTGETQPFEMDKDEPIRFRVEQETFQDVPPKTPKESRVVPYHLTASSLGGRYGYEV
ncbi:DNA-directed RNA polymerase III subunit RPC8 [Blyttiomyces sp. JEL0837]|nr:DNA-directed RNA polymerase III subunit RPC8 [Blyttiomyces sp. JEL0837]